MGKQKNRLTRGRFIGIFPKVVQEDFDGYASRVLSLVNVPFILFLGSVVWQVYVTAAVF